MIVPGISKIVDSRLALLLKAKSALYQGHINILEPIITNGDRKITTLRDTLISPNCLIAIPGKYPV